jgi:hypothetical protein
MSGYRPVYFVLQELVPPEIHTARGEAAWELLDVRALMMLDALRRQFGAATVNNWHLGGTYKESGLRSFSSVTGAKLSQHRFGRAFDCKFRDVPVREAYEFILLNPGDFPFLSTLEDIEYTPSWLHFDVRNSSSDRIRIVKP